MYGHQTNVVVFRLIMNTDDYMSDHVLQLYLVASKFAKFVLNLP